MGRPNHSYEKRRRELEKKKKQEAKRLRKLEKNKAPAAELNQEQYTDEKETVQPGLD